MKKFSSTLLATIFLSSFLVQANSVVRANPVAEPSTVTETFAELDVTDECVTPDCTVRTSTWSVVAADPSTGAVGVAAATCLTRPIDGLAALVPGKGAGAIQALVSLRNRNKVFELLKEGQSADAIVEEVTNRRFDRGAATRQYGIVTFGNGTVETATFSGSRNNRWSGGETDTEMAVAVQGNILVGEPVVADAMQAFKTDDPEGKNTLSDRLMRGLEAGSKAGGDRRCNSRRATQTAASAFILVACGYEEPYAARGVLSTDAGTAKAPWLALSVTERKFGDNPVFKLRESYDAWRSEPAQSGECPQPG